MTNNEHTTKGVVLLDVDGTLVDSNLFHALAWWRTYVAAGHVVPYWKIAKSMGMGGDQVVAELLGDDVERDEGDALRAAWADELEPLLPDLQLLPGSRELISALARRGLTVVLASSGNPEHVERATKLLDSDEHLHSATDSGDAEASKPAPDLFAAAWEKTDAASDSPGLVIGDSPSDCRAATAAGLPSICLRTGGHSDADLLAAGASLVLDDPAQAVEHLAEVLAVMRPRQS